MALVGLMKNHRAELRADFRQYYGCSFEGALRESAAEAADLAVMLPRGSRVMAAVNPEYSWTQEDYLLADAANSLRILVWSKTKDGQKNRNRPKPIEPPKSAFKEKAGMGYTADEYRELLSRPRKGV
jgi:hypothetical protein